MPGYIFGVSGLVFWVSELVFWVSELVFWVLAGIAPWSGWHHRGYSTSRQPAGILEDIFQIKVPGNNASS